MRLLLHIFFLQLFYASATAQKLTEPIIKLVQPYKTANTVSNAKQFITGSTCKQCSITVNDKPIKVYSTGAFAIELNLKPGDSTFTIKAESGGKTALKKISYTYTVPKPAVPVKTLAIESIEVFPEGSLSLQPGDKIQFKVKALPRCQLTTINDAVLQEMPLSLTKGMPGIYQGEYSIQPTDSFFLINLPFTLTDSLGNSTTKATKSLYSVMSAYTPDVAKTKGRLAHLEYGLGNDRLGGAKVGYLDSNVLLKVIGKVGSDYKIQLAKNRTAYIPEEHVELMPKGTFAPNSLTDKWNVYGDSVYDYVKIGLFARLPYQSFQLIHPSRIVVDIFGATNNTNWITQLQSTKEIAAVDYEQVADDIFRVTIQLKHHQHWGHSIYYSGNSLVIRVKQQPQHLLLKNLTIAVDAGHGGSNNGAVGATGVYEKEITLALSLKLQQALKKEGAKVMMTRENEHFFDNKERILFYRDNQPDLLLSIHLNSSEDPFRAGGTSTYYRYIGFQLLSLTIYKRLLELGLKEYGNTGSFNFMLNSPTEYPNVLIETLFISNLEEEEKILNNDFQQQMVEKIIEGIKDFLQGCSNE
ncbi:MAG TPA: N-acetylmuramoyl-L-alanine amidase [Ferruginibacter sp.]|nr:N-acetylmuramoyl-L-alanine amidase [Ferruginibacter sp.]HMP19531.1 N-acetylmuramoyl-L-alanine amidase [Ferruginibacter sp.]